MILATLRASAWKWAAIALAVLAVAAVLAAAYFRVDSSVSSARADAATGRAQALESQLAVLNEVLSEERAKVQEMADVGAQHEQDKDDAKDTGDAVAADVRSGDIELRDHWAGCATDLLSATATATRLAAENAELRSRDSGDLVQVGARCDAHVTGLQRADAVIRADRP